MAGFELKGKIVKIYKTEQVTETFKKREIVLVDESNPQYPEYAKFQFTQDKVSLLDNYSVGDVANIHFNIKGRPSQKPNEETKYFSNLQGWKIEGQGSAKPAQESNNTSYPSSAPDDDDLPF